MSKISLVIKLNQDNNKPCALCGRLAEEIQYTGPVLFIEGTEEPVCLKCGEMHAPDLVSVLDTYFERAPE